MMDTGDSLPRGTTRRRRISLGRWGIARDVDREFDAHIQLKVDELIASGLSADEAEREARRAFGDQAALAREVVRAESEHARATGQREWWQSVRHDVRIAVRGLTRSPGFTVVALATLALGIGANTALFSAIDAVILRGVPAPQPDLLVAPSLAGGVSVSKERLEAIRDRQRTLTSVAAYSRWGVTLTGQGTAEQLNAAVATADLFDALGVRAVMGRGFMAGDDRPGSPNVAVLSHALWNQRFGGDSTIVGRAIQLNGLPHTVVGVMPAGFHFPVDETRLWIPTRLTPADTGDYVSGYLLMVGRLRPGVTRDAALTDLRRVVRQMAEEQVSGFQAGDETKVSMPPLRDVLVGRVGGTLLLLFGAVGFVLLIACVNVANLLLARANVRSREFAIRTSLGAGRRRLVRQLMTESLLLSLAGGAAGLLLAMSLTGALVASIPTNSPGLPTMGLDWRVLLFALALSLVVGLVFGVAPAARLARRDASELMRDGGRGSTHGKRRHGLMRGLVVAEVSLALVLTVGAGLVLASFWRLRSESPGFNAGGVLSFTVTTDATRHANEDAQTAFFRALFERLRALPGVESVGAIHLLPLGSGNWNPSLGIEGRPLPQGTAPREVDWRLVTPEYFPTMGIPLVDGRLFDENDRLGAPGVALVNRELVRRYFPGENPIGKRVRTFFEGRGNYVTIVGIVGNTKDQALADTDRPQIYRSLWQRPQTWMSVMVRSAQRPMSLAPVIRNVVAELDVDAPVTDLRPLTDVVSASIAEERLVMWLLLGFGTMAMVLGMVGIYGVMSYVVEQRTAEMGVRLAMGARPADIRRLVLGDALRLTLIGLAAGTVAALVLTRFLTTQLHEVSARDPRIFASTVAVLAVVALLASWIPARRASRAEPTALLRVG